MNTTMIQSWQEFSQSIGHILPPRSETDYRKLVRLADRVADALGEDESLEELLDLLTDHIARWEEQHLGPIEPPSPAQMLAFYLEQQGLSQSDLAREGLMDQGNLSKVLKGERGIGLELARRLATRFNASPAVFLPEVHSPPSASQGQEKSGNWRGIKHPPLVARTAAGMGQGKSSAKKPTAKPANKPKAKSRPKAKR